MSQKIPEGYELVTKTGDIRVVLRYFADNVDERFWAISPLGQMLDTHCELPNADVLLEEGQWLVIKQSPYKEITGLSLIQAIEEYYSHQDTNSIVEIGNENMVCYFNNLDKLDKKTYSLSAPREKVLASNTWKVRYKKNID